MPNPGSDEPIVKVTLNLFAKDVETLKRWEGHGWTTWVRSLVRQRVQDLNHQGAGLWPGRPRERD